MAMRNFLMRNIMGAATYGHHAFEAFRTLRATGEGKSPFKIKDPIEAVKSMKAHIISKRQKLGLK